MYKYVDGIETAESEFDEYNYSYFIQDSAGEIVALCCTEEYAKLVTDALNKGE